MDYQQLPDEELTDLLFTEEDRLPRIVVDEFIRLGERMVPFLSKIVSNQFEWIREGPEWWAVVHASFILGAIGTPAVVIPLLRALRWADAHDCDWVTEAMPAMLGRIGPEAAVPLKAVAADPTSGRFTRSAAMSALAVMASRNAALKEDISRFIHAIFVGEKEDLEARQESGNALLDLRCSEYRDDLLAFGRRERERKDRDPHYLGAFYANEVDAMLESDSNDMAVYDRDWLTFYDEAQIKERQERWEGEEAEEAAARRRIPKDLMPVAPEKTGRNEPCPCGSGKKYKKCCLGK